MLTYLHAPKCLDLNVCPGSLVCDAENEQEPPAIKSLLGLFFLTVNKLLVFRHVFYML